MGYEETDRRWGSKKLFLFFNYHLTVMFQGVKGGRGEGKTGSG